MILFRFRTSLTLVVTKLEMNIECKYEVASELRRGSRTESSDRVPIGADVFTARQYHIQETQGLR